MIGVIFVFVIVVILVEKYSIDNALAKVEYNIKPDKTMLEPNEKFVATTSIANKKRMAVPFIGVTEYFPFPIEIEGEGYNSGEVAAQTKNRKFFQIRELGTTYKTIHYSTYLKPKSVMQRKITLSVTKRGRYIFNGASITGGDYLGLTDTFKTFSNISEVCVMPERINCPKLTDTFGGFLGDVSVNRFIIEDPILTIGYREYTGREPQKAISWTQSARSLQLMVKKYDYTLEPSMIVLLNTASGSAEELEACFSITRMICEELEDKDIKYSFMSNASCDVDNYAIRTVPEGLGDVHLLTVLRGLSLANYSTSESFDSLITRADKSAEAGASLVLITSNDTTEYMRALRNFESTHGGKTVVFSAKEVLAWT